MLLRSAAIAGVSALAFATTFVGSARSTPRDVATAAAGGVFIVTYMPQRVTSRTSGLRVGFTTTGRAQPGWQYYVYFFVHLRKPKGAAKPR